MAGKQKGHITYAEADAAGTIAIGFGLAAVAAQWVWNPVKAVVEYFTDMHPRVRGLTLIMLAGVILLFTGLALSSMLWDHVRATGGPVLEAALVAPYALDGRPVPHAEAEAGAMLPASLGVYILWEAPEEPEPATTTPVMLGTDESSRDANAVQAVEAIATPTPQEQRAARLLAREPSPLGACLMSSLDGDVSVCDTPFLSLSAASGTYLGGNDRVDLFVARFRDAEKAAAAINNLRDYARSIGRIGNFVMGGVGEVDFFYSFSPGWVSFSWVRENWVFTMAGTSFDDLETMVEAFPY